MATITSMTGPRFDAMPDGEGRRWELIDGELIPVSSPTPRHQDIVLVAVVALRGYFASSGTEGVAYQHVEFALTEDGRLRPDVCALLGEKARRLDRDKVPIPGAPDIAVDVISPSERSSESHGKVRAYLRNGTAEVWQVYPKSRTVQIHRGELSTTLEASQQVVSDLLPGFAMAVTSLFE
jgi:Uma2 family endonuclease